MLNSFVSQLSLLSINSPPNEKSKGFKHSNPPASKIRCVQLSTPNSKCFAINSSNPHIINHQCVQSPISSYLCWWNTAIIENWSLNRPYLIPSKNRQIGVVQFSGQKNWWKKRVNWAGKIAIKVNQSRRNE